MSYESTIQFCGAFVNMSTFLTTARHVIGKTKSIMTDTTKKTKSFSWSSLNNHWGDSDQSPFRFPDTVFSTTLL